MTFGVEPEDALNPHGGIAWWKWRMYLEHLANAAQRQRRIQPADDESESVDLFAPGAAEKLGLTLIQGEGTG